MESSAGIEKRLPVLFYIIQLRIRCICISCFCTDISEASGYLPTAQIQHNPVVLLLCRILTGTLLTSCKLSAVSGLLVGSSAPTWFSLLSKEATGI